MRSVLNQQVLADAGVLLDKAGSFDEAGLCASIKNLIDDTNRQQQAVTDAAKSCGIEGIDAGEAAERMASEARMYRAKWSKATVKEDVWLAAWKVAEAQRTDLMYQVANLKGALAASEARR